MKNHKWVFLRLRKDSERAASRGYCSQLRTHPCQFFRLTSFPTDSALPIKWVFTKVKTFFLDMIKRTVKYFQSFFQWLFFGAGDKIIAPLKVCNRRKALSLFVCTDKVERKEKKTLKSLGIFLPCISCLFPPSNMTKVSKWHFPFLWVCSKLSLWADKTE